MLGDVGALLAVVSDDVEVGGVEVDVFDLDVVAFESIAVGQDGSFELLEKMAVGEMVYTLVGPGTVGQERITVLDCDAQRKLLAGFGVLTEAGILKVWLVRTKVVAYEWTLDVAFSDGHPAKLGLCAVDGKGDDAHPHGTWRTARFLEVATDQFVDIPVGLLAFSAAVMDVFAAGAEHASRLGTGSTLIVGRCHNGPKGGSIVTSVNCEV